MHQSEFKASGLLSESSRIHSIRSLRRDYASSPVLSFDIEGKGDQVSQIGIALLPCFVTFECEETESLTSDGTFKWFVHEHRIQVRNIAILGRGSPKSERHREKLKYGFVSYARPAEIEATVVATLSRLRLPSMGAVFVYFGGNDLKWVRSYCPGIMHMFSAWADITNYVKQASGGHPPSLRNSITALRITENTTCKRFHNAGNDTVRSLAVLAALYTRDPSLKLSVTRTKLPKFFDGRPSPRRRYPFTARLETVNGTALPPTLTSCLRIYRFFSEYTPWSTGKEPATNESKVRQTRAWVTFRIQQQLETFLSKVNESAVQGIKLKATWDLPRGTVPPNGNYKAIWKAQQKLRNGVKHARRREEEDRQRDLELESGLEALFNSELGL